MLGSGVSCDWVTQAHPTEEWPVFAAGRENSYAG